MASSSIVPARAIGPPEEAEFWRSLIERKRNDLEAASPGMAFPTSDMNVQSFQSFLHDATTRYARKNVVHGIQRISASLSHCVCRFSNDINSVLDLIADVNEALPLYERALALRPGVSFVKWPLQDLFNDYMDCCVEIAKEFSRNPIKNLFRNLISSRFKNSIQKATQSIKKHQDRFFKAIEQADREATTQRDVQALAVLGHISTHISTSIMQSTVVAPDQRRSDSSTAQDTKCITTIRGFPNPSFVGREVELQEIYSYLDPKERTDDHAGPRCVIIHGLGGQGKTQVALQYSWRYKDAYDAIFLIKSETTEQLGASYLEMARKLQQANQLTPPASPVEIPWEIDQAIEWLEGTNKRWLLIFDNVEDSQILRRYLSDFNTGSIIVTTQHKMSRITRRKHNLVIELQPLSQDMGTSLFYQTLEPPRDQANEEEVRIVREICKWVGGLPLALVTVAGYMSRSEASAAEIWGSLTRSSDIWESSSGQEVNYYERTLKTVFDLALEGISPNSRHFLNIVAFLSPDGIPEVMLRAKHRLPSLHFLDDDDKFLEIRNDLLSRQLIKRPQRGDDFAIEIHRSLQRDLLLKVATNEDNNLRAHIFAEVSSILNAVLPEATRLQQNEKELWPVFYAYVPQVIALLQNSQWPNPPLELDYTFAKMLSNVGTFLWHVGFLKECENAMTTAYGILDDQPAEVKDTLEWRMLTSDIYLVVGIMSDFIGVSQRRQSLDYRQKLLALREIEIAEVRATRAVEVDDEIRWGNAKGDLACAYLQRGEYTKTRALMEELFVYYKKWGTEAEYPFEYSKYYHHLGHVLMMEHKPDEAIRFSQKGMELDYAHAGGVDATVLVDQYDTASLKFNAGRVEEALAEHQNVLKQRLKICGPSSVWTLTSFEAVGILQHLAGDNENAEHNLKASLDTQYQNIWSVEGIARARYWYSRVLEALGKDDEAEREYKAAAAVKASYMKKYSEFFEGLTDGKDDDAAVFDRMLPMWILQTSGPLQEGGRNPLPA